jgi:hypothetical protein
MQHKFLGFLRSQAVSRTPKKTHPVSHLIYMQRGWRYTTYSWIDFFVVSCCSLRFFAPFSQNFVYELKLVSEQKNNTSNIGGVALLRQRLLMPHFCFADFVTISCFVTILGNLYGLLENTPRISSDATTA